MPLYYYARSLAFTLPPHKPRAPWRRGELLKALEEYLLIFFPELFLPISYCSLPHERKPVPLIDPRDAFWLKLRRGLGHLYNFVRIKSSPPPTPPAPLSPCQYFPSCKIYQASAVYPPSPRPPAPSFQGASPLPELPTLDPPSCRRSQL